MSIGPGAARRGRTAKLFHADIRHQSGGLAAPSGKHRRPGIYLDSTSIKQARGADAAASAKDLPAIKTSIVKAPADTALLVEHINILNALFSPKLAGIASPKEQFEATTFAAKDFTVAG